ncbi:MAG: hypothetical protein EAZ30_07985 [Betaproteobacteria bacterium]|nr:MAG: hypothetical protein EAZ30_07985 [Betaproteobacteria bacterium]
MIFALQILYIVLGVGANVLSLLHRQRTGKTLTPVNPRDGLLTMAVYALCMALMHHNIPGIGVAMLLLLLAISYKGVYLHIRANANEYATAGSRWSAIAINSFGVVITAAALAI